MNRIAGVSVLAIALAPALAHADQVFLKNGGMLRGEVVENGPDRVVVEVGPGRVTLPIARVARVVSSTTDLGLYRARAETLGARNIAGWLDLAAWAEGHELGTQARAAYEHVLSVDPRNGAAHLALGHVPVGDKWMRPDDAHRAQGLVEFEGMWMTPAERQARMEESAALAHDREATLEAQARAREAEARAREAEARAGAAEAEAREAGSTPAGIPYPYVFGGGYGNPYVPPTVVVTRVPPRRHPHTGRATPPPPPPERDRNRDLKH